MAKNIALIVMAVAAALGLAFAAVSTHDFVQHLDRQVHGLSCSYIPGVGEADTSGESGCHVTLMSPYSSVFRERVWGGVPIALPAIAVFGFLFAFAAGVLITRRKDDERVAGFGALAWGLPTLTSLLMGYISFSSLGAACKLCIGIYFSSGVGLTAALTWWFMARSARRVAHVIPEAEASDGGTVPIPLAVKPVAFQSLLGVFGGGVLFVVVPVLAYVLMAPDFGRFVGTCGQLASPADEHGVLIAIGPQTREVPVLEVLDPLCPACKGFEARFEASSIEERASRRVLLFPLDNDCNWMVDRAIHPGACGVSEAVLCAGAEAEAVIEWAFENQEAIVAAAREDADASRQMARARFPAFADCIGSPPVQNRLNRSLRWAVDNELPVLTPQIYVGDTRLCDADTDLGMDFALGRLVERYQSGAPSRSSALHRGDETLASAGREGGR